MARRPKSSIPTYKRKRPSKRGLPARIFLGLVKLVVAFVVLSVLWVGLYRFVPPPTTATMIGDIIAGNGARRDWMPISHIDRDMSEIRLK